MSTHSPDLSALIARLEAATEGSRELGEAVYLACGWTKTQTGYWLGPIYHWGSPDGKITFAHDDFYQHDPTTSIDAALTLVPAHHMWEVRHGIGCRAVVWTLEQDYDGHSVPVGNTMDQPALALCIASLKARQVTHD